ncbi:MAG: SIMPL domain-containing protein [Deltaproteobacteria bacterium]|nr:SIMPL domain-containing protein [Deltaproteobacteria bacterium]
MKRLAAAVLTLALLVLAAPLRAAPPMPLPPPPPPPAVTVAGEGEASAPPDSAEVELGVLRQAKSARDALDENGRAVERLLASVKALGVPSSAVQTVELGLAPQYQHEPSGKTPPRIIGYQATHRLRVLLQDLGLVGRLLDEGVAGGANLIQSLRFTVRDPSSLLDRAREKAVEDARRRASRYAGAAGLKLGRVLELREIYAPEPLPVRARFAAMEAAVPVAPGEETVRAAITATWELVSPQ